MFTSVSSRFLVGFITSGTLLNLSYSAECNTFETDNECEPIAGCFWNVDHCDCASDITMDVAFLLDSDENGDGSRFVETFNEGVHVHTELSVSTTPEPTVPWENPRIWISGDLCEFDRCECHGEEWDCEGEPITRNFAAVREPQFVTFKKWQEEYPWLVSVQWQIELLSSEYDAGDEDEQGENEERRRLFEFERMGNSKTTETTESPLTIAETTEEPLSDSEIGIDPRRGVLIMNSAESEKRIAFGILKQLVSEKRRYRLYRMKLGPCESEGPHECELAYPSSFYMIVDINGGKRKDSECSSWRLPWWFWPMIVALFVIVAVLSYIGYKHWTNERMTKKGRVTQVQ